MFKSDGANFVVTLCLVVMTLGLLLSYTGVLKFFHLSTDKTGFK